MLIIDAHTHAFPDAVAARAVPHLAQQGHCKAVLDGTVSSLLRSMDQAGIERSVICSIATKPEQWARILEWSLTLPAERFVPLGSVHPGDPDAVAHIHACRDAGLKGIKLHPYYQDFDLDDARAMPLYAAIDACGLVLVSHTGFDVAFARTRKADPRRILAVLRRFPGLKFVATHLGAWEDWGAVTTQLLGLPVYMELSCSLESLPAGEARAMLMAHPADRILFGTDSPWHGQQEVLDRLDALKLPADRLARIKGGNAAALFGLV